MQVKTLANNQTVVIADNATVYFQSYETMIAKIDHIGNAILISEKWNCSKTTAKWTAQFLNYTFGTERFNSALIKRMINTKTYNDIIINDDGEKEIVSVYRVQLVSKIEN